jgi:hypothetical protein
MSRVPCIESCTPQPVSAVCVVAPAAPEPVVSVVAAALEAELTADVRAAGVPQGLPRAKTTLALGAPERAGVGCRSPWPVSALRPPAPRPEAVALTPAEQEEAELRELDLLLQTPQAPSTMTEQERYRQQLYLEQLYQQGQLDQRQYQQRYDEWLIQERQIQERQIQERQIEQQRYDER